MKNTNYNMKGVRIALADWHKLKDALTAFIRANYTNYSFDDTIKKVGEYLALEEYIYGRTYYMCSTYAWCNDRLFTTKDEAAFKAATDPMAWMENHIERLSERDENLERDLQREASIDKYRAERVAYYEKAKEPEIENIADTLNCCADYGATVARKAAERQEAYSYLEGKDLCSRVTEINSYIASLGFGLMTSVGMLNTLCRMAGVPLIAENVEVGNLETFVAFAKEVVDSYFTTGPVGSVSES